MSSRRPSKSRREEAERLHRWCTQVVRFIREEAEKAGTPLSGDWTHGLDVALRAEDVPALRVVARDLLEWARSLPEDVTARIDARLRDELGVGLVERHREVRKDIAAIVARGSIADNDECRLLMAYADEVSADPTRAKELRALEALIRAYRPTRETP